MVDDDPDVRLLLENILEMEEFRVATAADGGEAVEAAFNLLPDAILLDYAMPKIDGWECAERIRGNPRTQRIPIIAVTAHAAQHDRNRAMSSGVDGFIVKPFQPAAVVDEVRRVLTSQDDLHSPARG